MKKRSYCTVCILLVMWFAANKSAGQIVIDLSTGIQNAAPHGLIPIGNIDDTWRVSGPHANDFPAPTTPYAQCYVTTGVRGPAPADTCVSGTMVIQKDPSVRWLAPRKHGNGDYKFVQAGCYFYKAIFDVPNCEGEQPVCADAAFKSAFLNFNFLSAESMVLALILNGNYHSFPLSAPLVVSNYTYTLPISELHYGQNEIIFVLLARGCHLMENLTPYDFSGWNLNANITINTFALTDKDGNEKSTFCIDEDVFLNGAITGLPSYYNLVLYYNGGVVGQKYFYNEMPNTINLTDVFYDLAPANFLALNVTGTYKVELYAHGACHNPLTMEFKLVCCEESASDGSFSAKIRNSKLQVKSPKRGSHEWKIYSTPKAAAGPYQYITTKTGQGFSMDIPGESDECYYVSHKLSNVCGEVCVGQDVCRISCQEANCNMDVPLGLHFDGTTFSWLPVAGATKYYLEFFFCDAACCAADGDTDDGSGCAGAGGGSSMNSHKVVEVQGTSHLFDPGVDFNGELVPSCFSWRVFAKCANGSRSKSSFLYCSNGDMASRQTPGTLAKDPATGTGPASENTHVTIFPNPAYGVVSIDVRTSAETKLNISIMNNTGSVVKDLGSFDTSGKQAKVKWDTKEMARGIYLIKVVTSDTNVITRKLVVE